MMLQVYNQSVLKRNYEITSTHTHTHAISSYAVEWEERIDKREKAKKGKHKTYVAFLWDCK